MNVFTEQATFMQACGQAVGAFDEDQYNMYLGLIEEEMKELQVAVDSMDKVEQLDALIDILVVTIGALHSAGFDAAGAWSEVMSTNFAKIDKETGKVRKRADGKVLKPADWQPPNLAPFVKAAVNPCN
ncbi:NTP pyrophosphohydrolase, DR2231-like [uncultured Caudovirales phage]|uniref:NTP pyrophosphohydrolase, DR2231-like n=1 Tax=uncultured Caudovirales phage TaxID=2100421 RepID=A0A6J5L9L2_9CAUD|nr:NTP pyrophosphohydrolase, DR2231-like [uncultured Caudovirales phage]